MKSFDLKKAFRDVRTAKGAKDKAGQTVKLIAKTAFNTGIDIAKDLPQYKERLEKLEKQRKEQDAKSSGNVRGKANGNRSHEQSKKKYAKKRI